ncbi:MAG: SDR family NAD(P)-dependent oxidoreductase [Pseudomonadota bacterium]
MPQFETRSTALIIGASGGIGLALVQRLIDDDRFHQIIATARQPDQCQALAELAATRDGLELHALDATNPHAVSALADRLRERSIRPRLIMYCAGLLHDEGVVRPEKRLEDIEADAMARVFAVNTIGPALVLKAFLPLVPRQAPSVVALVSARVGSIKDNRLGGWYAYRSSKAALNQLMRTASIEARRRFKQSILLCLHPGTTDTALSRPFQANVPEHKLFEPAFVAERFLAIVDELEIEDSGAFLAWDGATIPW